MGIYACPRCGNPNGWWSGNMRDVHDCPGPPRRHWPQRPDYPATLDWSDAEPAEAPAPADMKLVPREPTPEMLDAVKFKPHPTRPGGWGDRAAQIWRLMWDAHRSATDGVGGSDA